MPIEPLEYVPYDRLDGRAHVVVDGSPTEGTTLTLTHWPGFPAAPGTEADLSAQMAFRYLRLDERLHGDATAVTNNHFDQDGLVSVFTLVDPSTALEREDRLVDVAAAGDFATYGHRDAARASMAVAALADPERSPVDLPSGEARVGALYEAGLDCIVELVDHPDRYRDLWADEDAALDASERLLASGRVGIAERPDLDLTIVDLPDDVPLGGGGHRFAHHWATGLHPMALHRVVGGFTVLVRQGRRYELTFRYESWVQYRSRPVRARRDLSPLAAELSDDEPTDATWTYDGSDGLAPRLHLDGADESAIAPDDFVRRLEAHLESAPPDWDPFAAA